MRLASYKKKIFMSEHVKMWMGRIIAALRCVTTDDYTQAVEEYVAIYFSGI